MKPPLQGISIIEFEGIGPAPLAAQILAGMGAEVTVIVRPEKGVLDGQIVGSTDNPLRRGKKFIVLDLKNPASQLQAIELIANADALIEGYRPGVMERLGLGPSHCAQRNPRLVYGRMTGWGQNGPLAQSAGHDLNYVALTGLLSLSAHRGQHPIIPPTVVGDASGALGLAFGMVCALLEAKNSGCGRVVDGAIIDILAMLGGIARMIEATGNLSTSKPSIFHDSPFYDVYLCADGKYISIAALEPAFYKILLDKLGLNDIDAKLQYQTDSWADLKSRLTTLFASQPCAHWCSLLEGSDACFAPVLSLQEALTHPHSVARQLFQVDATGAAHAMPAPRFTPLNE